MISIIVPVYNVEKYLHNCLRSISQQTFMEFEVMLVDDGSTDKSGRICDDFAKKDNRFKVFHKQNGGVSSARNFALNIIQGDFVYFCDADDILFEDALKTLIMNFNENVDCTMGGYIKINEQEEILEENKIYKAFNMSIEETLFDFYQSKYYIFNGYIWNRLFKRNIIQKYNIRFREDIYIKEDGLFLVQYLCNCSRGTFYTTKPIYKYVEHGSSAMNHKLKNINKESISRLTASIECYKELRKNGFSSILPLAKKHTFFVRQELLRTDKSKGLSRLKFRFYIDRKIAKDLSFFDIINVYHKRFVEWKRFRILED